MKGGYIILALGYANLLTASSIPGAYETLEGNHGKPVMLSQINISDVEKTDIFTMPEVSGSSFVLRNVYGYDVTINDDDTISVAATQWATKTYADSAANSAAAAKTVYCHPITLRNEDGTTIYRITMLVFNNSSAQFTLATLQSFLDSLAVLDPIGKILVSGAFTSGGETIIGSYLMKSSGDYLLVGIKTSDGTSGSVSANSLVNLFPSVAFEDGVNAVN